MNKYQKAMEHVKVDDEMKKRILQNVEKELSKEGGVKAPDMADKIVPFGKRLGDGIRQYAGIAAMFAILLVSAAAVVKMTGGVSNMSTSPAMSETAMEAPAATESTEMAEAPATEAPAAEEAAEAPAYEEAEEATYDSDSMAEAPATEEAAKPTYESETATEAPVATENAYEDEEAAVEPTPEPAGSAEKAEGTGKTETGAINAPEEAIEQGTSVEEAAEPETVSWTHYIAPILLPIILIGIIVLIIWLIVRFIRRRK